MRSSRKIASIVLFPAAVLSVGLVPALRAMGQQHKDGPPNVVRKSSEALLNSVVSRIAPVYPAWAPHTGSSTAAIKVVVSEDGSTLSAGQVSGDRLVGWSAIEALRRWRWQPTLVGGAPARVLGLLSFTLASDGSVIYGSAETAEASNTENPTDADLLSANAIALFKEVGVESKLFEQSQEVAIRINDSNDQPLVIEQARVRSASPEPRRHGTPDSHSLTDLWPSMRTILLLRNTGNKRVTSAEVRFTNRRSRTTFLVSAWPAKIDPQDVYAAILSYMLAPGDAENYEVEVASARFEDGKVWKSKRPAPGGSDFYDAAPDPTSGAAGSQTPSILGAGSVDLRPIPLNNPRPNYTELARRNKVMGTSRLRILVGANGLVKRVNLITFLPD